MTNELYLTIFDKLGNLIKTDCGTIKTVDKWITRGYVVSYTDDSKAAAAILEAYENEMRNTYKGKTMKA